MVVTAEVSVALGEQQALELFDSSFQPRPFHLRTLSFVHSRVELDLVDSYLFLMPLRQLTQQTIFLAQSAGLCLELGGVSLPIFTLQSSFSVLRLEVGNDRIDDRGMHSRLELLGPRVLRQFPRLSRSQRLSVPLMRSRAMSVRRHLADRAEDRPVPVTVMLLWIVVGPT